MDKFEELYKLKRELDLRERRLEAIAIFRERGFRECDLEDLAYVALADSDEDTLKNINLIDSVFKKESEKALDEFDKRYKVK